MRTMKTIRKYLYWNYYNIIYAINVKLNNEIIVILIYNDLKYL